MFEKLMVVFLKLWNIYFLFFFISVFKNTQSRNWKSEKNTLVNISLYNVRKIKESLIKNQSCHFSHFLSSKYFSSFGTIPYHLKWEAIYYILKNEK